LIRDDEGFQLAFNWLAVSGAKYEELYLGQSVSFRIFFTTGGMAMACRVRPCPCGHPKAAGENQREGRR
jgi:hypothetical protein